MQTRASVSHPILAIRRTFFYGFIYLSVDKICNTYYVFMYTSDIVHISRGHYVNIICIILPINIHRESNRVNLNNG